MGVELLEGWQQDIEREQWQSDQESDRLSAVEQAADGYLRGLRHDVQVMDLQLNYFEDELKTANQELAKLEQQLARERQTYAPQLDAAVARLRFLQQQSFANQGWSVLLRSQNLSELFDRRARLKQVYAVDRQRLLGLQQTAVKLKAEKITIEEQKNEIALLQQQILAQKADFEAQLTVQQDLINRLNADRETLAAAQLRLAKDSEGIRDLIQTRVAAGGRRSLGGTRRYLTPHGGRLSSGFGWRWHPKLGGRRFHGGIDFAGEVGSPIFAADTGVVIFAGWYGGYGKTVIIDHGEGVSTLYGHNSKTLVTEGQPVERGVTIAELGSSGLSTGPHLHFEIRHAGKPVNPLKYLTVRDRRQDLSLRG
ncbi:MAG: peptidoglycan DD-metalloendopeptidase family protein [Spirulinaceae cyanobacterium RM2_2_10]|nr:peptidoglycan DD-metalloendopeptidase family protein [Spirulinaceae cyanobacterium SM2_1_0]NJO20351.1 peptidoglycan DD-metalloendopeptidase family protein [Spirulinaceae cyanobacterium RM2_2_10]